MSEHVIIAGYGLTGQNLAHALEQSARPYIIVDLNAENVRRADRLGQTAVFGDITSAEVLEHLAAENAAELVIAINDPDATVHAIGAARLVSPDLRITVRTAYIADEDRLIDAGATVVITAEAAAADTIVAQVLTPFGPPEPRGATEPQRCSSGSIHTPSA